MHYHQQKLCALGAQLRAAACTIWYQLFSYMSLGVQYTFCIAFGAKTIHEGTICRYCCSVYSVLLYNTVNDPLQTFNNFHVSLLPYLHQSLRTGYRSRATAVIVTFDVSNITPRADAKL